jgi:hypothetical protein
MCHGHLAATCDPGRIRRMRQLEPFGTLDCTGPSTGQLRTRAMAETSRRNGSCGPDYFPYSVGGTGAPERTCTTGTRAYTRQ